VKKNKLSKDPAKLEKQLRDLEIIKFLLSII
jgi:hypothetical protein